MAVADLRSRDLRSSNPGQAPPKLGRRPTDGRARKRGRLAEPASPVSSGPRAAVLPCGLGRRSVQITATGSARRCEPASEFSGLALEQAGFLLRLGEAPYQMLARPIKGGIALDAHNSEGLRSGEAK